MVFTFKTKADSQQWQLDSENLTWQRVSSLITTPSVTAAENDIARFVPVESGILTALGGGRYVLEGRKPFDENGTPQLAVVIFLTLLSSENSGTCVTFIQSNVEVEGLTHEPISKFETHEMPPITMSPKSGGARAIPPAMPPVAQKEVLKSVAR